MPAALRLLYLNHGLAATFTARTQVSSMPVRNLASPIRQEPYWAQGCTDEWIEADFGVPVTWRGLALVSSNLTPQAVVRARLGSTPNPDTVVVPLTPWDVGGGDSGVLVWFFDQDYTYRYVRITFVDPANPDNRIKLGVAYCSPLLDLGTSRVPVELEDVDPSITEYASSGTPHSFALDVYRRVTVPMALLDRALVFPTARQALRRIGTSHDGVLSVMGHAPSEDDFAKTTNIYGRFTTLPRWMYQGAQRWSGGPPEFRESL